MAETEDVPAGAAPVLLADIGGTNARFAMWRHETGVSAPLVLHTADYPTFGLAMAAALESFGERPRGAVVAAAGMLEAGQIRLTNAAWTISAAGLRRQMGGPVRLVNDVAALAYGLDDFVDADLMAINPGLPLPPAGAPRLVLALGTGFGAALSLHAGRRHIVVPTEAGHACLAPASVEEDRIVAALRQPGHAVTIETVLSGAGIARLATILHGRPVGDPEAVTRAAADGDTAARTVITAFGDLLAGIAGSLALVTGARGGVYLGGGLPSVLAPLLDPRRLVERFRGEGPFAGWLASVPFVRIAHGEPTFVGLGAIARTLEV